MEINSIYNDALYKKVKDEFIFNKYVKLPKESYIWINKEKEEKIKSLENLNEKWAYHQKQKDGQSIFPQESHSETIFLNDFVSKFKKYNLKIFSKNYILNSNLSLSYKNTIKHDINGEIHKFIKVAKTYPDYILKYNKKTYFIEVKSGNKGPGIKNFEKSYIEKIESLKEYFKIFANYKSNSDSKFIFIIIIIKFIGASGERNYEIFKYSYNDYKKLLYLKNIFN